MLVRNTPSASSRSPSTSPSEASPLEGVSSVLSACGMAESPRPATAAVAAALAAASSFSSVALSRSSRSAARSRDVETFLRRSSSASAASAPCADCSSSHQGHCRFTVYGFRFWVLGFVVLGLGSHRDRSVPDLQCPSVHAHTDARGKRGRFNIGRVLVLSDPPDARRRRRRFNIGRVFVLNDPADARRKRGRFNIGRVLVLNGPPASVSSRAPAASARNDLASTSSEVLDLRVSVHVQAMLVSRTHVHRICRFLSR